MYMRVCVAGTFDGLHKGHEILLTAAFTHGSHVVIALTSDAFVRQYKRSGEYDPRTYNSDTQIRSYAARKKDLVEWLAKRNFSDRSEIISLETVVGPAATAEYDALIVTTQNRKNGEHINVLREQNGKPPLVLIDVPLVSAQDKQVISSTRVRSGEIDKSGRMVMPDSMRKELSQPLGTVLVDSDSQRESWGRNRGCVTISVGDHTAKTLLDAGVVVSLIIIDNMVNRTAYTDLHPYLAKIRAPKRSVVSGPGYISREAIAVINAWAKDPRKQIVLEISGEEDLLTLPAITYAPVGSVLYYGQPNHGLVEVVVTPEKKTQVRGLLSKFIS